MPINQGWLLQEILFDCFFLYFPFLLFLSNFATFLGWSEFCDDDLYREPTSFGIGTTVVPISANSISKELDCGYTWWDKRQNIHIYKKKWQREILSCRLRSQTEQITLKVGSRQSATKDCRPSPNSASYPSVSLQTSLRPWCFRRARLHFFKTERKNRLHAATYYEHDRSQTLWLHAPEIFSFKNMIPLWSFTSQLLNPGQTDGGWEVPSPAAGPPPAPHPSCLCTTSAPEGEESIRLMWK